MYTGWWGLSANSDDIEDVDVFSVGSSHCCRIRRSFVYPVSVSDWIIGCSLCPSSIVNSPACSNWVCIMSNCRLFSSPLWILFAFITSNTIVLVCTLRDRWVCLSDPITLSSMILSVSGFLMVVDWPEQCDSFDLDCRTALSLAIPHRRWISFHCSRV